jgi:protein O-mannosyl-transferase
MRSMPKKPPAPPKQAPKPEWRVDVLALAALAAILYANSLPNGFVGDDNFQLLKNPLVTDAGAIPRIFTSSAWAFLGIAGNYYRPLQFLVYNLIYQFAGFSGPAFHGFMILLHGANTALLYFLVRRLSTRRVAIAAAALFAVHPIHTEVVDWAASLPDLMMTALVLAGVLLFARQRGAPEGAQIAGHCGLYLAALLSKETGVMLLPLYAAFGFFCLDRRWSELRRNAVLYAGMAATFGLYLGMRANALGGLAPAQQSFIRLQPLEFALSIVVTAAEYLWALVYPIDLNYFHIFQPTRTVNLPFVMAALALAGFAAALFRSRVALLSFGLVWIAAGILPPLNLTGVGPNVFAERYLYLPSAGFCWIAAWAWDRLAARQWTWARAAGAVVLLVCAGKVLARNGDWKDSFTMLQVTIGQSPASGLMQDALAAEYVERDNLPKALEHQLLAVRYEPERSTLRFKLGHLLLGRDPRAALIEFRKAVELEPSAARAHWGLGLALEMTGDAAQAAQEYRTALQLQPQYPEAEQGLARVQGASR